MSTQYESGGHVPEFTVADRLRKAREYLGMDKAEFAETLGVSRNTVSNYELGKTKPRKVVMKVWAMATGVPLVWLQTGHLPDDPEGSRRLVTYLHKLSVAA